MRCAVIGDPVAHSLSPALHRAGYASVGLDWEYDVFRVPAGTLAEFVRGLDPAVHRGLSVTAPLKRELRAIADSESERVRMVGAANTLVLGDRGLHVDNTDLPGAVAAIRERYDGPVTAGTILGAGATAASTGLALCELGATTVRLLARDPGRAAETVEAIGRHPSRPEIEVLPLAGGSVVGELVVSTVPADAQDPALVAAALAAPVVFEVLYDPWPTPLADAAAEGGRVLVGGLDLLVHQAALQFTAFTGVPAPLAAMRDAGETELAARGAR
jgi:shikimate dehydrogenase